MLTVDQRSVGMGPVTHSTITSKLGDLTVVAREGTVVGLYFPGHWYRPDSSTFGTFSDAGFDARRRDQIGEYLAGDRQEFEFIDRDRQATLLRGRVPPWPDRAAGMPGHGRSSGRRRRVVRDVPVGSSGVSEAAR